MGKTSDPKGPPEPTDAEVEATIVGQHREMYDDRLGPTSRKKTIFDFHKKRLIEARKRDQDKLERELERTGKALDWLRLAREKNKDHPDILAELPPDNAPTEQLLAWYNKSFEPAPHVPFPSESALESRNVADNAFKNVINQTLEARKQIAKLQANQQSVKELQDKLKGQRRLIKNHATPAPSPEESEPVPQDGWPEPGSLYSAMRALGEVGYRMALALSPPTSPQAADTEMASAAEQSATTRSPTMARFFQTIRRYDQAVRAILSYLWHPQQYLFLIGATVGLGALAMTGGFHTGKEILYLIVIFALAARSINEHWGHERKKEITALLISLSILVFSGLLSWTEWQRYSEKPQAIGGPPTTRFVLTPGEHATPAGPACTGDSITPMQVKTGEIAVFVGDTVATTVGTGTVIVNIDDENVLAFRRATSEIYLDAIIRDSPGNEVGRITNNVVALHAAGYEALNPDAHNITIVDRQDRRVLSVRYVNESAIVVSGIFYGKKSGPFLVSDGNSISAPHRRWAYGENCFTDLKGPLFRLP